MVVHCQLEALEGSETEQSEGGGSTSKKRGINEWN